LVLAVQLNGDQINAINIVGLVTCLGGIVGHIVHKAQTLRQSPSPSRNVLRFGKDGHEMSEPLLLQGGAPGAYLVTSSSDEDSDENSDILYILGQRDRVVRR